MSYFLSLLHEGVNKLDRGIMSLGSSLTNNSNVVEKSGLFESAPDILNSKNDGMSPNGLQYLPASTANAIVVGGSSVGKTTHITFMTLFRKQHSFVVLDPSQEIYLAMAGFLKKSDYKVELINWSNCEISSGYNGLALAKNSSDIHDQATQLAMSTLGSGSGDKFWLYQSIAMLAFFGEVLFYNDHKFLSWSNVLNCIEIFSSQPEAIHRIVAQTNMPHLHQKYKTYLRIDDKLKMNIISSTLSCLTVWNDISIRRITSFNQLDFSKLRQEKTVLFLQSDVLQSARYSILNSMLIKDIITSLMSSLPDEKTDKFRVLFLLDEFASLYINDFDVIISNIRKYNASIILLVQNISQIYNRYGEHAAKIILSNCMAKVYFHSQSDLATLRELQDQLEQYVQDGDDRITRKTLSFTSIRTIDKDKGLLFYSNYPPVLMEMRPAYMQPIVANQIYKHIPPRANTLPTEIPLIV